MPTLYDNFSQVRQYIDENSGHVDLSSYVTKTELANASYVTTTTLNNASYVTQSSLSNMGYVTSAGPSTIYSLPNMSSWDEQSAWLTRQYSVTGLKLKDWIWSYAATMFSYDTSTGTLTITTA